MHRPTERTLDFGASELQKKLGGKGGEGKGKGIVFGAEVADLVTVELPVGFLGRLGIGRMVYRA